MHDPVARDRIWGGATPWVDPRSLLLAPPMRSFFSTRTPETAKFRRPRVEAAAGVEAQNAPTPAWKPQNGFSTSFHTPRHLFVQSGGSVLASAGGQKILSLDTVPARFLSRARSSGGWTRSGPVPAARRSKPTPGKPHVTLRFQVLIASGK